jgi:hypothetical protein
VWARARPADNVASLVIGARAASDSRTAEPKTTAEPKNK